MHCDDEHCTSRCAYKLFAGPYCAVAGENMAAAIDRPIMNPARPTEERVSVATSDALVARRGWLRKTFV
jgi:hypothetical protein